MKKIILLLLVLFMTGCSETNDEVKEVTNKKLQFTNESIVFENGISVVKTNITNPNTVDKKFDGFIIEIESGGEHTHIYELIVDVNKEIKAGETISISSNCEGDLTDNTKIKYSEKK